MTFDFLIGPYFGPKKQGGVDLNYIIILFSLLISTIVSVLILKKTNHKLFSMLSAFCLNMLILIPITWISYNMNDEARIFGIGYSGLYILVFAIPVITWANFLILQFVKK